MGVNNAYPSLRMGEYLRTSCRYCCAQLCPPEVNEASRDVSCYLYHQYYISSCRSARVRRKWLTQTFIDFQKLNVRNLWCKPPRRSFVRSFSFFQLFSLGEVGADPREWPSEQLRIVTTRVGPIDCERWIRGNPARDEGLHPVFIISGPWLLADNNVPAA